MFQHIRSVRVEYVIRMSSVTIRSLESVRKYKACGQTDRFAITEKDTQFYKLRTVLYTASFCLQGKATKKKKKHIFYNPSSTTAKTIPHSKFAPHKVTV